MQEEEEEEKAASSGSDFSSEDYEFDYVSADSKKNVNGLISEMWMPNHDWHFRPHQTTLKKYGYVAWNEIEELELSICEMTIP